MITDKTLHKIHKTLKECNRAVYNRLRYIIIETVDIIRLCVVSLKIYCISSDNNKNNY